MKSSMDWIVWEMLEKLFNDSDLLKFALDKFNITKEELIKEYKEDIKNY